MLEAPAILSRRRSYITAGGCPITLLTSKTLVSCKVFDDTFKSWSSKLLPIVKQLWIVWGAVVKCVEVRPASTTTTGLKCVSVVEGSSEGPCNHSSTQSSNATEESRATLTHRNVSLTPSPASLARNVDSRGVSALGCEQPGS